MTLETLTRTYNTLLEKVTAASLTGELSVRADAELAALEGLKASLEAESATLTSLDASQDVGMRNYMLLESAIKSSSEIIDGLIRINNGTARKTLEERIADVLPKVSEAKIKLEGLRIVGAVVAQTTLDFTIGELDRLAKALVEVSGSQDLQKAYLESLENLLRGIENSAERRGKWQEAKKRREAALTGGVSPSS